MTFPNYSHESNFVNLPKTGGVFVKNARAPKLVDYCLRNIFGIGTTIVFVI